MPDLDYCFIVNPAANGGLAGYKWPILQKQLNAADIVHEYFVSEYKGHCGELVRTALKAGHTNFVAVGGDGTANEVLNGLFSDPTANTAHVTLNVIPWGTGNDWARYYRLSSDPEDCVRLLQAGSSTLQDIGKVSFISGAGIASSHYFLNCVGTGFDSYLLEKMGMTRKSRFRYFLYVLKCLYEYRATRLELDVEGESLECPVLMLQICLGIYAGAGMQFAPAAIADDGQFEVLCINDLSVLQILASLFYLYNGKINDHWAVKHWRSSSISIATRAKQNFHCDGEIVGQLPIKIEILPRALTVIAPQKLI